MGRADDRRMDAFWSAKVEDTLAFLTLMEAKGRNVPDATWFDGVVLGDLEQVNRAILAASPDGRGSLTTAMIEGLANRTRAIAGGMVCSPGTERQLGPGARYEIVYGREMDPKKTLSGAFSGRLAAVHGASMAGVRERIGRYEGLPGERLEGRVGRVIELRSIVIDEDGRCRCLERDFQYQAGPKWHAGQRQRPIEGHVASRSCMAFAFAVLATAARRDQWTVSIRLLPGSPSACLFTDPTGVRDFFRFREIPEGRERREALAHWVRQHWRQDRKDAGDEIYVREHLRGQREFRWHGMECRIGIPPADLERLDAAKVGRAALAAEGKARRRKNPFA